MDAIKRLHAAVAAVCPVEGVALDGRIDFAPEATEEQRAAAVAAVAAFDPKPPVDAVRRERYREDADPLLLAVVGYDLELESLPPGEERTAVLAKRAQARTDYLAAKARIRGEVR